MNFVSLEDFDKANRILPDPTPIRGNIDFGKQCRRCEGTTISITNDGAKTRSCGNCNLLFKSSNVDILKKCIECGGADKKLKSADSQVKIVCYDCGDLFFFKQYGTKTNYLSDVTCSYCTSTSVSMTNDGPKTVICDGCGYLQKSPNCFKTLCNNLYFYVKYDIFGSSRFELIRGVHRQNLSEKHRQ